MKTGDRPAWLSSSWLSPRRLPSLIGQLLLVLIILLGAERWLTKDAIRGPAPSLHWTEADGRPMSLDTLRGRPLLIYFWATWCPVCRLEQAAIDALMRNHQALTIAMQSGSEAELRAWLAKEGLNWPLLADSDASQARRWGVKGVPTFFILSPKGEILFVSRGLTSPWGLKFRLWLANLPWMYE